MGCCWKRSSADLVLDMGISVGYGVIILETRVASTFVIFSEGTLSLKKNPISIPPFDSQGRVALDTPQRRASSISPSKFVEMGDKIFRARPIR